MFITVNKQLNILFLAQFPIEPNKGGVQRVTNILADEFRLMGHKVYFCSISASNDKSVNNQYYTSFQRPKELIALIDSLQIEVVINQAGVYKKITKIVKYVKQQHKDLKVLTVHHNCISCLNKRYKEIVLGNDGRTSQILKLISNPALWTVLRYRNKLKYRGLFKNAIKVSDQLVLLAESFKNELKDLGIKEMGVVTAIHNPASFKPVNNETKKNTIVYVGRLVFAQKRVDRLMKVLLVLHKDLPNWRFEILGDGSRLQWMLDFKNQNKLDRINFHGYSNPQQILKESKILLLPSDFEGFGMVIPEAQAYGVVPVVTPCFSAVSEVVGKGSGIVLEDYNPETMVKAVKDLIEQPDQLRETAKRAVGNVERFDSTAIASKWVSLMSKLLDEG
jgi:glycosyltransferase involved in cell wall biosynthesis